TMVGGSQKRGEASVGIEARPTQPIERTIARHQRGRLAIADQRVILDTRRHADLWPEIDDDLDVALAVLERLAPAFERDSTRNQPSKPTLVRARERGRRHLVVPPIGIDRPEYHVVVEHQGAVEAADIDVEHLSGLGDAGQADDSGRRRRAETCTDEGHSSGAFHQNVGSERFEARRVAVVDPAEIAHERLLRTTLVVIEHMHVEIALYSHEGRQKPDGTGAGDEQRLRLPGTRAMADALGVVPGLGEDAGGLQQYAENAQSRVDPDRKLRLEAEAFGAVAVPLLDPAFGVAAVATHVPLSSGASQARHRIGPAHDPDDEIAGRKPAPRRRRFHRAQRFMAEHKTLLTGRGRAITAIEDFAVGPAYAERQRAHQDAPIRFRRVGAILEPRRAGDARRKRDCAHPAPRLAGTGVAAGAVRGKAFDACSERRRRAFRQNAIDDTSTLEAKKSSRG